MGSVVIGDLMIERDCSDLDLTAFDSNVIGVDAPLHTEDRVSTTIV